MARNGHPGRKRELLDPSGSRLSQLATLLATHGAKTLNISIQYPLSIGPFSRSTSVQKLILYTRNMEHEVIGDLLGRIFPDVNNRILICHMRLPSIAPRPIRHSTRCVLRLTNPADNRRQIGKL